MFTGHETYSRVRGNVDKVSVFNISKILDSDP